MLFTRVCAATAPLLKQATLSTAGVRWFSVSESLSSKIVTVFGATGAQGGSVVRALTGSEYKVRAVTRNTGSDNAKKLADQGHEVISANLDDVDSLKLAFEGAHGAFVVTNYWEHMDGAKDKQQGINAVDAAKAVGMNHFIYSGLEDVKAAIGKDCHHFDSKGHVEAYLKQSGLPFTSTRMSFYMENLFMMLSPQKTDKGEFMLGIPMEGVPMDLVAVSDVGECIHQILNKREQYLGKCVGLSGDKITIDEAAKTLSKKLGVPMIAAPITTEFFATLPFPGAEENAVMFEFYIKGNPERDVALTRKLNPAAPTFEQWVEKHKDALLAKLN